MHEPLAHKRKALGLPFYFFCAFSAFLGRLLDWCVETRRSRELKKKGTGSQHTHMQQTWQHAKCCFCLWQLARATCVSSSPISPIDGRREIDGRTHRRTHFKSTLCVRLVVITSIVLPVLRLFSKYIQHRRGKWFECKHHSVSLSVRTREQISAQMWRSVFMINKTAGRKHRGCLM
jgi:hypothetical protein